MSWPCVHRLSSKRRSLNYLLLPAMLWLVLAVLFIASRYPSATPWLLKNYPPPRRMPVTAPLRSLAPRISCHGPRGKLLSESPDDALQYEDLDVPYPVPFIGSHHGLGAERSWMTADGRYGPYGFGEDKETYNRAKVDWDKVDWGKLQDECVATNADRFPVSNQTIPSTRIKDKARFKLFDKSTINPTPQWDAFPRTRRTAIILRGYVGHRFTPETMWFIRSLMVEAALDSGGEYAVFLLVDAKKRGANIFLSRENYTTAFEAANIPPELRSITVLWDDNLLESWYPLLDEHRTMWQVHQPLQLFTLHHPEFDHYWQFELDQRYMGHAGKYLDAVSETARMEPRKQALERSSFAFSEEVSGSYAEFTRSVDKANSGGSRAWGPIAGVPDIKPIGPQPPIKQPQDDDFWWGVGEDADVVVTSFCADVLLTKGWMFGDWIRGFIRGTRTPRWFCPPAIMRGSRTLLLVTHEGHHLRGQSVQGESVLPSFALWHGLKLSYPPQPAYIRPWAPGHEFKDETSRNKSEWREMNPKKLPWFGSSPEDSRDGVSGSDPQKFAGKGMTWWWNSDWARRVTEIWLKGDVNAQDMPAMFVIKNGKVYAPNVALHPVKDVG